MSKLVECKSCKHTVDSSAKTCPSCGVSKPGNKGTARRWAFIGIFLVIAIQVVDNAAKKKSAEGVKTEQSNPEVVVQAELPKPAVINITSPITDKKPVSTQEKLSDKNINKFLFKFIKDYFTHVDKLITGFDRYKDSNNYQGFVDFKNNVWLPGFECDRKLYDAVLEDNRGYISDNYLTGIFSKFDEVGIYANNLFFDLRRNDKSYREKTKQFLRRDWLEFQESFKERGLDFNAAIKQP